MSTIAEVKTLCREDCCAEIYRICNLPEAPNYQNNYTKKKIYKFLIHQKSHNKKQSDKRKNNKKNRSRN
jgi:hypothetical protein